MANLNFAIPEGVNEVEVNAIPILNKMAPSAVPVNDLRSLHITLGIIAMPKVKLKNIIGDACMTAVMAIVGIGIVVIKLAEAMAN